MLTPSEIRDLRQRVLMNNARQAGPCRQIACVDGPLANLRLWIPEGSAFMGWSTVVKGGATVAMYRPTAEAGRWRFEGWERVTVK